jgi:4-carboxymuconolactone decarboxylase
MRTLSVAARALVEVSVAVGSDDHAGLRPALQNAFTCADAAEVDEALLQAYLFVGYPRVLHAFKEWREIAPLPAADEVSNDESQWERRGAAVFEQVYGAQYEKLLENVARLHPDLERWMVVEGYGKVLGRDALDLRTRELCIIALLATQNALPQLYSHLRGALHVGATQEEIRETLALALARATPERALRAHEAWETVRSRRGGM